MCTRPKAARSRHASRTPGSPDNPIAMTDPVLDLRRDGPVATLRLNRPDKHNILAMADVPAFLELLDTLDER